MSSSASDVEDLLEEWSPFPQRWLRIRLKGGSASDVEAGGTSTEQIMNNEHLYNNVASDRGLEMIRISF